MGGSFFSTTSKRGPRYKGGLNSERFFHIQKELPNHYPKLFHLKKEVQDSDLEKFLWGKIENNL